MALNPRCYAFSEISNMVSSITRKNFKLVCKELAQVSNGVFSVVKFLNHLLNLDAYVLCSN